jgi:hypothetical protein
MKVIRHDDERVADIMHKDLSVVPDRFHDHVRYRRLAKIERTAGGFVEQSIQCGKMHGRKRPRLLGRTDSAADCHGRHVMNTGCPIVSRCGRRRGKTSHHNSGSKPLLKSVVSLFGWRALLLVVAPAMFAQTSANISGTVHDATGAVLRQARVAAHNVETGITRTVTSGEDGRFFIAALPVGRYELRAELDRFRPSVQRDIVLTIGQTRVVDVLMEVGGVDQEVTVTAQGSAVNTTSAELSYLVSENTIRDLPLNGRNYTDLALLQPGVIAYPHRDGGSVVAHGLGMSVNGQDPRSNVYLLDGTTMNDFTNGPAGSAAGTALGMDTVREFRVETNAYSAEFGRNSGGQINALTKSGTNDFHGTIFEYLRNDNFDARNFFDPERKPEFKRNQFGGTIGGPVAKDRTFFFLGYEALRERLGRTITSDVPDLNARQGIIGGTTYQISPAVKPFLDEYPLPTGPDRGTGLAAYSFLFNQKLTQDFGQARFDHNFNDNHQMFARYTYDGADQRLPTDYPQFPRAFLSRNQFVTTEFRQVISPRTLNFVRLSFSRTRVGQDVEANTSQPLPAFIPGRTVMGNIDIGGLQRFGPQTSVTVKLVQNVYGVEQGLTLQRGQHLIKVGGLAERYQDNLFNPTFGLGIFTFNDLPSFLQNRPARFLGLAPNGALDRYWRFTLFGMYVQDDWKIHPRVTLNAGLRYEFSTMPVDIYGRDSSLPDLFTDTAPTPGELYENPTYKNFSPRIGLAWDVFGDGRMSIRSGYGVYFNTNNQQNLIVTITNPPATPRVSIANPTFPNAPFERGVGNSMRPVEWNIKNPYVQIWNVSLQRQLPGGAVATLGYAGSRGIHLWRSNDVNIAEPEVRADGSLFFRAGAPRRNTAFSTIELKSSDGNSWYNAMIFEVRKQWNRGFSFQSSYTFARNLDTTQASTFFSDATNGTTSAMPEFPGFNYNKGLSDYHAKHNWVMSGTWQIPFGKGLLASGWQISAISQMRSGNPLTAFVRGNRSRSQWAPSLGPGIGFDRPSLAPGRTHESAVLGGPDQYFDPKAFVLQPAGTLGALGRGTFIGPNLRTFDLSLMKNFRFAERTAVQFRAEAFNLFNRANFGSPNLTAFAGSADNEAALSTFGRIRSTVTSSRQIQLGLRLTF